MCFAIIDRSKQRGSALLAIVLVFIIASSYVLLRKFNVNTRDYTRRASDLVVLNEAKAALIGYAVNYPLDHPGRGPGHLPCPDINNDGDSDSPCALAGPTNFTIGRLPYKSTLLNLSKLRDSSGETLWYAVADNYRSNVAIGPNSDTAGDFSVDGNGDIVAVIFAPGAPVASQNRSSDPLDVSNYLEDDNANGDNSFVSKAIGEFNDTLVTITRQELMSVVEKRVLADVDEALTDYQTNYNAYPWLSAFADPSASAFRGANNTWQGHLPFHWSADPDSINQGGAVADRNPFTTDITLSWALVNANAPDPASTSYGTTSGYDIYSGTMVAPGLSCTESSTCVDDNYPGNNPNGLDINGPITFTNATCTWSNKEVFQCTGTYVNTMVNTYPQILLNEPAFAFSAGPNQYIYKLNETEAVAGEGGTYCYCWQTNVHTQYAYTETVTRTYTIDITFTDSSADGADIQVPTTVSNRTRDLTVDSNDNASALFDTGTTSITLSITDDRVVVAALDGGGTYTRTANSTRTLTNDGDTIGSITATGVLYDIDIDDDELPSWFVENGWHELIYVAYASSEILPGDTTDVLPGPADGNPDNACTTGTDCISVNVDGTVNNNVRALVLSAGVDLSSPTARPSGTLTDYFEGENSNPVDDTFIKDKITTTYNDQTRIISTAP